MSLRASTARCAVPSPGREPSSWDRRCRLHGRLHPWIPTTWKLPPLAAACAAGEVHDFGNQVVAFRVGQHHIHAEAGHEPDDSLRDGKRFAVARRIGPAHGDLLAPEIVETSEVMLQVEQVGHALRGVVHVALQVDDGGPLGKDSTSDSRPRGPCPLRPCSCGLRPEKCRPGCRSLRSKRRSCSRFHAPFRRGRSAICPRQGPGPRGPAGWRPRRRKSACAWIDRGIGKQPGPMSNRRQEMLPWCSA